ncbi:hypothetical protein [Rhodococcus rhodochrous]|uniref:hypothetical protein n=1 Tax=Rhodococcus rhodochrous TaxID=1829 RepID=UPI0028F7409C|nr:hypothetical protein [Rhodococcus rhodochrous]
MVTRSLRSTWTKLPASTWKMQSSTPGGAALAVGADITDEAAVEERWRGFPPQRMNISFDELKLKAAEEIPAARMGISECIAHAVSFLADIHQALSLNQIRVRGEGAGFAFWQVFFYAAGGSQA